jgi:stalled ribosome alternative rescue factor ArfA
MISKKYCIVIAMGLFRTDSEKNKKGFKSFSV